MTLPGAQPVIDSSPACPYCSGKNTEIADTLDSGQCHDCGKIFAYQPAIASPNDGPPTDPYELSLVVDKADSGFMMSVPRGRTVTPTETDLIDSKGQPLPKKIMGFPVTYVWKDMSSCGDWINSVRGFKFPVTMARIDHWVDTFNQRRAYGARVPIVDDHSEAAEDANGQIVKVKRDGKLLMGMLQLVGPDAARKAATNDVSVATDDMTDGNGVTLKDVLRHVALTPLPMNPGLGEPKLAASRAANSRPKPAAAMSSYSYDEGGTMPTMLKCSDACLSGLHSLVPGLTGVADDAKMDHIHNHIKQMAEDDAEDAGPGAQTMSRDTMVTTARSRRKLARAALTEVEGLKTQVQKMSAILPTVDKDNDGLMRDLIIEKKDKCVEKGALTKDIADKLEMSLIGTEEAPAWLGMARVDGAKGRKVPAAAAIFDLLAENHPILAGRKTAGQMREMSRTVPGANDKTTDVELDPATAVAKFNQVMGGPGERVM